MKNSARAHNTHRSLTGFTLIELMLVVGFLSVVAAMALFSFRNQSTGTLESEASIIASRLALAQSYAIASVNGKQWGIHFNNVNNTSPFYALFNGSTYTSASSTYYLPSIVNFQTPASTASTSIVFSKFTGKIDSASSIVIGLTSDSSQTKTIVVSPEGKITIQ